MISYINILEKINNYMNNSGIRQFCREQCSGSCCLQVANYTCTPFIPTKCESRLPCSLYICDYLEATIINIVPNGLEIVDLLREIDKRILNELRIFEGTNSIYTIPSDNHLEMEFDFSDLDLSILDNPLKIWGE